MTTVPESDWQPVADDLAFTDVYGDWDPLAPRELAVLMEGFSPSRALREQLGETFHLWSNHGGTFPDHRRGAP